MLPQDHQLFSRFLDRLDDYLYDRGWYTNGYYIRQQCKSFEEVEKYLIEHCYSHDESIALINKLKTEITLTIKQETIYGNSR